MLAIGNNGELADRLAAGLTIRHQAPPPPWAGSRPPFMTGGGGGGGSMRGGGGSLTGGGGSMTGHPGAPGYSPFHPPPRSVVSSPGPGNVLYSSYNSVGSGPYVPASPKPGHSSELYSSSSSIGMAATSHGVVRMNNSGRSGSVSEPRRKPSDAGVQGRPVAMSVQGLPPTHSNNAAPSKPAAPAKPTTIVTAPRVMTGSSLSKSQPRPTSNSSSQPRPTSVPYTQSRPTASQPPLRQPSPAPSRPSNVQPVPSRGSSQPMSPPRYTPQPSSSPPRPSVHTQSKPPTQPATSPTSTFGVVRRPGDSGPPAPQHQQHEFVQEVGYLC
mmetsp:Transcript_27228/g.55579  ORF Transcript_27228/g.55579 Transcript_27228/m.55579 type:complete len:326 (+) Transcript_27228:261-1238(+)